MKTMKEFSLWGVGVPSDLLSIADEKYLQGLPAILPTVEWVWAEMDRVWDHYSMNNREALLEQSVADFYSHPAWLMNGVFTSLDPISNQHRNAIAEFISKNDFKLIADYAGGFGELAIKMAKKSPDSIIRIIEPYPSDFGLYRLKDWPNIEVRSSLGVNEYNVVIAQDVLEHVEDPIGLAFTLAESVEESGYVIFANCFYPVIKCHLPKTFHLRYMFRFVMFAYGLKYEGRLDGAKHVMIFRKFKKLDGKKARAAELVSKSVGGFINMVLAFLSGIKKSIES